LAVAETLLDRGCDVQLIVSEKEVDQQAASTATGMDILALPAVALTRGGFGAFLRGFRQSLRQARAAFRQRRPKAVLAMGGFTSAPPVVAGKWCGAATFLHESNTRPGRANRWIARLVDRAFVGFMEAGPRLGHRHVIPTGTPVRAQFAPANAASSRTALGLDPLRPVLLIQGGSQGAQAVNGLVTAALPRLRQLAPQWQYLHLAGLTQAADVKAAYAAADCRAVVLPFLTEMELALAAATLTISRAGASSLAELAAMQVPSILIPFPTAIDNHQYWNARACSDNGAALILEERDASPERLTEMVAVLANNPAALRTMRLALARRHTPCAAELIADKILAFLPEFTARPADPLLQFSDADATETSWDRASDWSATGKLEWRSQT
jgi:UDP-N-acetylglucosamine--N-acetylmuramyl-(pentapeptide) pyrophosphoryl-undecaprenol N-acetylglucosamine transferase